jgi:uncharacterized membrane protein
LYGRRASAASNQAASPETARSGVAAGAVLGLLFPPGILIGAAAGGFIGGAIGHFWRGMSRKDVLELGEFIDAGQAALVLVGESAIQAEIDKAVKKADKRITRQIEMDRKAYEKEIKEAAKGRRASVRRA